MATNSCNNSLISDISFLQNNEVNQFSDVTIDQVTQLLQRKKEHKVNFSGTEEYQSLKEKMKKLKMRKLPFRTVELVNKEWKNGKTSPLDSLVPKEGDRKAKKQALRQALVTQAKPLEESVRRVEQINFFHGTNSALLPMIHDTLELIPSGRLLDTGRAPMGGEFELGGMGTNGVNQHALSGDTVAGAQRCWKYAFKISNTFKPEYYEKAEELFLENLELLKDSSPSEARWDCIIMRLLRLKQWNPSAFVELCEKHQAEVETCKETVKNRLLTEKEQGIQKAINYDMDFLIEAKKEGMQGKVPDFFKDDLNLDCSLGTWEEEIRIERIDEYFDLEFKLHVNPYPGWSILLLRMFTKEILNKLLSPKKNEFQILIQKHNIKILKKICFGNESRDFTDDDLPLIFEKLVVEKFEALVRSKMTPFQRRYDRMIQLFDSPPAVHFTDRDREMIEKPFGILLASTKAKASYFFLRSEVNFNSAKLGDDIDLAFVTSEHVGAMNQWLLDHDLIGRVKVYDEALIRELEEIPLRHAPDQVKASDLLIQQSSEKLNDKLNTSVFPLYRQPYPNGEGRYWHGVTHSARTALFSQVLLEMAHEKGVGIKHDPIALLIAMSLHDVARKNDGVDLWDEESGQMAKEILIQDLKLSEEDASFFASCIADKDKKSPTSIEQRIIHDGDCIEIMRCLNDPLEFKTDELRMKGLIDNEMLMALVNEARGLIELTDRGLVREFLEESKTPYQVLLEVIFHAYTEYGTFECIAQYTIRAKRTLCPPSKYMLTPGVEDAIKEWHLSKR